MSTHTLHTTCPMDCPDTCVLDVVRENGTIRSISAGSDHPDTDGFICSKVARFPRRLYHPDRLLTPMIRVGKKGAGTGAGTGAGEFVPIGWDAAIGEITHRLKTIIGEWGGEAILPYNYGGSNGFLTDSFIDDLYFARLGASKLDKTICAAPTGAVAMGMYGKMPGVAFADYTHASCIVVWGANPRASNIHLMPILHRARQNGAFIASVDPIQRLSDGVVDLHLPVRPGTDLVVALAMINLWRERGLLDREFLAGQAVGVETILDRAAEWSLERAAGESGVPASDIERLATVYAEASPAVIRCGWGPERNRNGGHAIAAILAMPALLGKFGARGGGYTLSNKAAASFDRDGLFEVPESGTRTINMTELGAVLTGDIDPPVKALFVYNCNPAATVPDQNTVLKGLGREDLFTVVFDQVLTDSAPYADILLPATTFLEHHDVRAGYGSYVVGGVRPVLPAMGEARSNPDVFAALGRAMGFQDPAFQWSSETAFDEAVKNLTLNGHPADPSVLKRGGVQRYSFPGETPVQFETVHPRTPDGKVHLRPEALGTAAYEFKPASNEYPLGLISPATSKLISSTLGEFNLESLRVLMHPTDAATRGIANGDRVRVFNDLGDVVCEARVRDTIRPGVVSIPKGAWRKSSGNGMTATALCPADVSDVGGGACFNDARVEVRREPG